MHPCGPQATHSDTHQFHLSRPLTFSHELMPSYAVHPTPLTLNHLGSSYFGCLVFRVAGFGLRVYGRLRRQGLRLRRHVGPREPATSWPLLSSLGRVRLGCNVRALGYILAASLESWARPGRPLFVDVPYELHFEGSYHACVWGLGFRVWGLGVRGWGFGVGV